MQCFSRSFVPETLTANNDQCKTQNPATIKPRMFHKLLKGSRKNFNPLRNKLLKNVLLVTSPNKNCRKEYPF
jgi:hypothetical protein